MCKERARSLIHPLLPLLKSPLERVINDGIGLLRVSFEEVKVKDVDGILAFVFSFVGGRKVIHVLVHELFGIFNFFECLFEIVLTTLAFLITFLDELEGTETEATFAIRFAKEADRLAFDPESADGLFIG